jgi:prepilin-type N-terminal cleavage/methylation domain-containing protein
MNRSRAFSLVELLVVVAIVALLLALLLPSLSRAKEAARMSSCASNLHQIGIGVTMYAHTQKGWLPPYYNGAAPKGVQLNLRWPNQTCIAYNKKPISHGPWNLAHLYDLKLIADPAVFYCPSQQHEDHLYDTYPVPWGQAAPPGKLYIFTSYTYNPYKDDPNVLDGCHLYRRLDGFPPGKILTMDIPFAWSTAHREQEQWTWNILYGDGHAELRQSAEASAFIRADPAITSDWVAFGEAIDLLDR